ncbi:MAG TPA: PAS domain-containing sensor histidine kinase [Gemmatimonadota bacterium]|nr:PAS domain-containing sensor histidine kinase [Gemmatimonadota bacterium]
MITGSSLFTAALFVVLAAFFLHLHRRLRQPFLLLWFLAWLILSVRQLTLVLQGAELSWLWADVAALPAAGALFLVGAFLLVGPARLGAFHAAILGLALGAAAVLAFTGLALMAPELPRPWTAAVALLGIASIGAGWLIDRYPRGPDPQIARLPAAALITWGALQPISWVLTARPSGGPDWLVLVEVGAGTLLTIAMILFGLEVARTHLIARRIDPRDLFDEDPNMILVLQDDRPVFVNRAFRRRSGLDLDDILRRDTLEYIAPEYRDSMAARHATRLAGGPVEDYESELLTASGERVPVIVHVDTLLWQGRQGFRYELTDITTRRRAEAEIRAINAQLQRINTELEKSNQLKTDFLSNTSHELKTPLTSIIANTEILEYEMCGPMNDEQRRVLANISRNSQHLLDMISRLLDFARHEEGHAFVRYGRVDLRTLLVGVVETVRPLLEDGSRKITTQVDERIGPCYLDGEKIYRVYLNLVENAIKFSEGGEIGVGAELEGDEIEGWVVDRGIGIPPDRLEEIFDAFRQVDASSTRPYQGVGLGLAICKQLIELHGGRIWVESTAGEGSAFRFRVPYEVESPDSATAGSGVVDAEPAGGGAGSDRGGVEWLEAGPRSAS